MKQKCPVCGRDDTVMKVSAVIAGAITISTAYGVGVSPSSAGLSGSYEYRQGLSQTELSRSLTFSPRVSIVAMIVGGFFLIIAILLVILALYLLSIYTTYNALISSTSQTPIFLIIIAIFVGGCGIFIMNEKTPKDGLARATWEKLYYCPHDDVVYDPDSGKHTLRSQMNTILY